MHADFVAFFGSHFLSDELDTQHDVPRRKHARACGITSCVLLSWLRQVQGLATAVSQMSDERCSVHLITRCLHPRTGTALNRPSSAPVTVHPGHALELRRILGRMWSRACPHCLEGGFRGRKFQTLLKWQVVGHTQARLVAFMDLDVEVLPWRFKHAGWGWPRAQGSRSGQTPTTGTQSGQTSSAYVHGAAIDWLWLLRCALDSPFELLSYCDHSAPINAGLMLLKPNATLYREARTTAATLLHFMMHTLAALRELAPFDCGRHFAAGPRCAARCTLQRKPRLGTHRPAECGGARRGPRVAQAARHAEICPCTPLHAHTIQAVSPPEFCSSSFDNTLMKCQAR